MMNLNAILDEVTARLETVPDLRVYGYEPDTIAGPPAAIVLMPDEVRYQQTYGDEMYTIRLSILVLESRVTDRVTRKRLAALCSDDAPSSIKRALQTGSYTSFHDLRVEGIDFDHWSIGGTPYAGALFETEIIGS